MLDNTADLIRARLSAAFDKWVASDLTRTKKQLAQLCQDALGVPCTPQTVNGWFKTGRMDKKWIPVLADVLGVNLLSGNDGPPFDANVRPAAVGMRAYPVISKIQAGRVKERTAPYEPGDGYAVVFGDDDASPWAFFSKLKATPCFLTSMKATWPLSTPKSFRDQETTLRRRTQRESQHSRSTACEASPTTAMRSLS